MSPQQYKEFLKKNNDVLIVDRPILIERAPSVEHSEKANVRPTNNPSGQDSCRYTLSVHPSQKEMPPPPKKLSNTFS
jgi:hypothetical protein